MNTSEFNSLLPFKVQDIVSILVQSKHISFDDAVRYLYHSKTYEKLANEDTKLWHLSSDKLVEILEIENNTGKLIYPDFV